MHTPTTAVSQAHQSASNLQDQPDISGLMAATMEATTGGDAFDGSAEPIVYMSENRMPVMIELNNTIIYIVFVALVLTFLFILPGVRRTKLTSFLGLLTLLILGASTLLAIEGSHWLTGSVQIYNSPYGSLTRETITGKLEVNIGLSSANVTLFGILSNNFQTTNQQTISNKQQQLFVEYNERFHWDKPDQMIKEHLEALRRGLPYPILSVTEFLSQDSDGFNWARQLRNAGYFTSLVLYLALASWCLTIVIMCILPVYLPHMMQITGALLMCSIWIYTALIQTPKSFSFQIGGNPVEFAFGYTYVTTFIAGALSMFAGIILFAIQLSSPHDHQFTIMDSEQYVKDQKALGSNLKFVFDQRHSLTPSNEKEDLKIQASNQADSVIIPIEDIMENFAIIKQ